MSIRADHVAGTAFVLFGLLIFLLSRDLPIGSLSFPSSGFMPKLLATLLIAFGSALILRATTDAIPLATAAAVQNQIVLERIDASEQVRIQRSDRTRGYLLASAARGNVDDGIREELVRIRNALRDAGLRAFLPPIEAVLAA